VLRKEESYADKTMEDFRRLRKRKREGRIW